MGGGAERAVQLVENQARTLLAALEDRLQWQIPPQHAIMHWLIRHASYLLSKFHFGGDHLTGYQRLHGRGSSERIAEFGEHVLYYVPKKRRTKLEPIWRHGIFLGRAWDSDSNFIGLSSGQVTTARAMVRTIEASRWQADRARRVCGTPQDNSLEFNAQADIEAEPDPHRGPPG